MLKHACISNHNHTFHGRKSLDFLGRPAPPRSAKKIGAILGDRLKFCIPIPNLSWFVGYCIRHPFFRVIYTHFFLDLSIEGMHSSALVFLNHTSRARDPLFYGACIIVLETTLLTLGSQSFHLAHGRVLGIFFNHHLHGKSVEGSQLQLIIPENYDLGREIPWNRIQYSTLRLKGCKPVTTGTSWMIWSNLIGSSWAN